MERSFSGTEMVILKTIKETSIVKVKRHSWFVDSFEAIKVDDVIHGEFGWLQAFASLVRDSIVCTIFRPGDMWGDVSFTFHGEQQWNQFLAETVVAKSDYETKSSGDTENFATGARRDTQTHKTRWDLVPPGPLKRLANLFARGAEHYGENNYQKGIPVGRIYSSMLRHVYAYREGDQSEDHLAAIAWNAMAIMFMEDGVEAGRLPEDLLITGWEWEEPTQPSLESKSRTELRELAERLLAE